MIANEISKILACIAGALPLKMASLNDIAKRNMRNSYETLLADISYEDADRAVRFLLQTTTWPPSPADIRAAVIATTQGPSPVGGEAWGSASKAMREQGAYRVPGKDFQFRDPLVLECVRLMDWKTLCLSENSVADRARFIELYDSLRGSEDKRLQAPGLLPESQSSARALVAGLARQLSTTGLKSLPAADDDVIEAEFTDVPEEDAS